MHWSGKGHLKSEKWGYQHFGAGNLDKVIETTWKAKQSVTSFWTASWCTRSIWFFFLTSEICFVKMRVKSPMLGVEKVLWQLGKTTRREQKSQSKRTKAHASATQSLSQSLSVIWDAAFLKPRPQKPCARWPPSIKKKKTSCARRDNDNILRKFKIRRERRWTQSFPAINISQGKVQLGIS